MLLWVDVELLLSLDIVDADDCVDSDVLDWVLNELVELNVESVDDDIVDAELTLLIELVDDRLVDENELMVLDDDDELSVDRLVLLKDEIDDDDELMLDEDVDKVLLLSVDSDVDDTDEMELNDDSLLALLSSHARIGVEPCGLYWISPSTQLIWSSLSPPDPR